MGSGGVRIHRFGEVALPPGAVRDGEIVHPAVVTTAVKQLARSVGLKTKRVAVSVANRRVVVRQVDLPWLPPAEMRAALQFQAQDLLPMPIEDAILDYHRLEEFVGDGGARMARIMLVAADAGMVRTAIGCVRAAGLRADVVDLTPFALLRMVATLDGPAASDGNTTEAIVDIGAAVTNILVHTGGRPRFVRILMQGGGTVTDAVSENLGIPIEEAESLKLAAAMRTPDEPLSTQDPTARAVEYAAAAFVEEIRGSLDFYRAQPGATPLSRIVLSGGGSRLGNLAQRLGVATRLPVVGAGELTGFQLPRPRGAEVAQSDLLDVATVTVGLAMRMAS